MKKFLLIVFAVVIAAAVTYTAAGKSSEGLIDKAGEADLCADVAKVEIYAKGTSEDYTYVSTGAFNVYGCQIGSAGMIAAKVDNILGAAVFYDAKLALSDVLEAYGAKALSIDEENGCTVVYAYSKGCGYGVETDGNVVNMQIVLKEGATVVGSPLIMGSY